jgi:hypothetical protein
VATAGSLQGPRQLQHGDEGLVQPAAANESQIVLWRVMSLAVVENQAQVLQ